MREQEKKNQIPKDPGETPRFSDEETVRLTEEQTQAVSGGTDPATELPEIFD